jgi:hypothetical protein
MAERIVALVSAKRDASRPVGARLDHGERRHPFGMAVGETGIDDKAAAVLHQRMAHEAKLGFPAGALAREPGPR